MAGFDWFWKALGGKSGRNQKRSVAIVNQVENHAVELDALDDVALAQRAKDLTSGGRIDNHAEFLAILGCGIAADIGAEAVSGAITGGVASH